MAGGRNKPEYPPVLPPGRHHMGMAEVKKAFVDSFPDSTTRSDIFDGLEKLCEYLTNIGVRAEIWVDGSFISTKPDPEDTDISVIIDHDVFELLDDAIQAELESLVNDKNFNPLVHNFLEIRYPRDHPRFAFWQQAENEWSKWWSVGEKTLYVRGLPVLRLGENDVGNRLLRQ